ncbi:MAG: ion channel [Arenibacterium sp.]
MKLIPGAICVRFRAVESAWDDMFVQLLIGSILIVMTSLTAAVAWWALELMLTKFRPWIKRPPHGLRLTAVLSFSMLWAIFMMTVAVWIWAFAFWFLKIFVTLEASVYFSLVSFTTLGFGDILLPTEWRLLGGMSAANGLLIFGLLVAMLVETLRQTRQHQTK